MTKQHGSLSSSRGWKVLSVNHEHVPRLLLNTRFDASGYRVECTDLSRIWCQELARDRIVQSAQDLGSSIDPGDDDEQFGIFLDKIQSALNGEDGTSLNMSSDEQSNGDLIVTLSAPLPKPLPSFRWTINLKLLPSQHVERELVTPLMLQVDRLTHQIQALIAELQNKDRVISKICDRLETSGNDLTTVFPGVSYIKTNRKKPQREQLARHVRGLADFDENAWIKQSATQNAAHDQDLGMGLEAVSIEAVLRDLPRPTVATESGRWWERLGRGPELGIESSGNAKRLSFQRSSSPRQAVDSSSRSESLPDDEFQRQGTPPSLKRPNSDESEPDGPVGDTAINTIEEIAQAPSMMAVDDESTTKDEDDLDAPVRKPASKPRKSLSPDKQLKSQASASPGKRKLGMLGGRTSQAPAPSEREPTPKIASPEPKPRSKLGMIGGKAKVPVASRVSREPERERLASPSSSTPSKLGVLGGKRSKDSTSPLPTTRTTQSVQDVREPSPRKSRPPEREPMPQPRERSQERADRKRDQLKRELEEKAKAPVKKKRKF